MAEVKEKVKEPQMGLTFEKVWAMFQETDKKFAETRKELAEYSKETDRKFDRAEKLIEENAKALAETGKYLDKIGKRIDNLGKQLGEVNNRFGDVVEHLVIADVINKFNKLGYKFKRLVPKRKFKNEDGSDLAEADILLGNCEYLMVVEVKAKPDTEDVKYHVARLWKIRNYLDKHGEKRKLLGAIAGAVMNDNVRELALKNGLYILEQSGETMKLLTPEGNPRMWLPTQ
jgi:hypothetical protein